MLILRKIQNRRITIYREDMILNTNTPVSGLYNKKDSALEIVVDVINLLFYF
jgi:hypothetical protein